MDDNTFLEETLCELEEYGIAGRFPDVEFVGTIKNAVTKGEK